MKSFTKIICNLEEGNRIYRKENQVYCKQDKNQRKTSTLNEQKPKVIVLSCADSRVPVELVFNKNIGELFVVRVAGNIANSASIASIEYAIAVLEAKVLVVMGHEGCGAVKAAGKFKEDKKREGEKEEKKELKSYHLDQLLGQIEPAIREEKDLNSAVEANVYNTINMLTRWSKTIRDAQCGKKLVIRPAIYRLKNGKVDFLPEKKSDTLCKEDS